MRWLVYRVLDWVRMWVHRRFGPECICQVDWDELDA